MDLRGNFAMIAAATILVLTAASGAHANSERVLYTFTGGADGASPLAGLIIDANGNLYGTTSVGGLDSAGVVFKLSPKQCRRRVQSEQQRAAGKSVRSGSVGWVSGEAA